MENPIKSVTRQHTLINGFPLENGLFRGFYEEGEKVGD
jgi:hypothetical protein